MVTSLQRFQISRNPSHLLGTAKKPDHASALLAASAARHVLTRPRHLATVPRGKKDDSTTCDNGAGDRLTDSRLLAEACREGSQTSFQVLLVSCPPPLPGAVMPASR